jgi:hypothetical protein
MELSQAIGDYRNGSRKQEEAQMTCEEDKAC